ncbi:TonB family protein [Sphingomonas pseudosanguinis]|uniref:TonB family protein n=1 Tax=Sphingomonas pseudosanguinis TaxID=413712 RepID=UPI003F863448
MRGRVRVAVLVDNTGEPRRCVVLQSSGEALLDQSTCRLMLEKARFDPARNRKGRAVAGVYWSPRVRWMFANGD